MTTANPPDRPIPLDIQHTQALADLIGHTGADEVEFGWLNDSPPWQVWAKALFGGRRIYAEHHANVDFALFQVAREVVHGGLCVRCGRKVSFPHATRNACGRFLVYREPGGLLYVRKCDRPKELLR